MSEQTYLSLFKGAIPIPGMFNAGHPVRTPLGVAMATVREVAEETGVSVAEIMGPGRTARVAHARHAAMHRMRSVTWADGSPRWSLPSIGRFFNRDHTTVIAACRGHERRMAG